MVVNFVPGLCTYNCSRSWDGSRWQPWQRMVRSTQSIYHRCRTSFRLMASRLLSTGSFLVTGKSLACSKYGMPFHFQCLPWLCCFLAFQINFGIKPWNRLWPHPYTPVLFVLYNYPTSSHSTIGNLCCSWYGIS